MGAGVPYAIGAKFAHPDRPVVALMGDGAMQMNGMAELLTIGRYRDRWSDGRLVVCVLHNNDLNQVTWELRAMGGAPKFEESQVLPEVSYADFATGIGLPGITVRHPDQLRPAWEQAFAAAGPTVIDVYCDPEVPPIPPHATLDQRNQTFIPHVLAIAAGTTVDFPNSDNTYHNVFSISKTKSFDLGGDGYAAVTLDTPLGQTLTALVSALGPSR
jgi:thiamine pyrophosphate-dependent acetolactate synthase large subunit-like protein